MSGAFQLTGGAADKIRTKISSATPVDVAGSATAQTPVVWFQVNEASGGVPNLTVEIYNATTAVSYYLGANSFTWKAKAMTALQSIQFTEGFMLERNEFLRITVSTGVADVVGLALLSNN